MLVDPLILDDWSAPMSKSKTAAPELGEDEAPTAEELLDGYLAHREQGKEHYAEADACLGQLIDSLRGSRGKKLLTASSGEVYELVDQFADRNTVFGHSGVRRFELKPVKERR